MKRSASTWGATVLFQLLVAIMLGGMAFAIDCGPGLEPTADGMACQQCSPGEYSNSSDSSACMPCPAGWYQGLAGQSACTACPPGTFNPDQGSTSVAECQLCPENTFNPIPAGWEPGYCQSCPVGTVSPAGSDDQGDCTEQAALCGNGIIDAGEACDDGNMANGDCCSSLCQFEPSGSSCSDGLFCNGAETCESGVCQAGIAPNCDDGVPCTEDGCDEVAGACVSTPNDGYCNDGAFCTGTEVCDPAYGCFSMGDPCVSSGQLCNDVTNSCMECFTDANCSDGTFCNGVETCAGGVCQAGTPPDCSDGVACTEDACDPIVDACVSTPVDANCPDDGDFCTGAEYCSASAGCTSTGNPCCAGEACNELTDTCDQLPEPPNTISLVTVNAGSLQEAIDAVADGGTIYVPSGSFEITEPVYVTGGKTVSIAGAGSGRNGETQITQLIAPVAQEVSLGDDGKPTVSADEVVGAINIVGATVYARDINFVGSDAPFKTWDDAEGNPSSLHVKDTIIEEPGRGVLHKASGDLTVQDVTIDKAKWNGVSVSFNLAGGIVEVIDSKIFRSLGYGIYVANGPLVVYNVDGISYNQKGGILGVHCSADIRSNKIHNNNIGGVILAYCGGEKGEVWIVDNLIYDIRSVSCGPVECDGHAILLIGTDTAEIVDNWVPTTEGAGVANLDSIANLTSNLIHCSTFDLTSDGNGVFYDNGGNQCGCYSSGYGQCAITAHGVTPPESIGGIE